MKSKFNLKNIATFAVAAVVGVCMSYLNVAHAGIVSDIAKEPIDDFTTLITEDVGNTMALLGVIIAIAVAAWYQSVMTGIGLVLGVGIIWAAMEQFG